MTRRTRPSVLLACVADHYHAPRERIVEFSYKGKGGLISLRELNDGRFITEVYRVSPGVEVLAPPGPPSSLICVWQQDTDGLWQTDCGHVFVLEDGLPADNGFKHCAYCGHTLVQKLYPPEEPDGE